MWSRACSSVMSSNGPNPRAGASSGSEDCTSTRTSPDRNAGVEVSTGSPAPKASSTSRDQTSSNPIRPTRSSMSTPRYRSDPPSLSGSAIVVWKATTPSSPGTNVTPFVAVPLVAVPLVAVVMRTSALRTEKKGRTLGAYRRSLTAAGADRPAAPVESGSDVGDRFAGAVYDAHSGAETAQMKFGHRRRDRRRPVSSTVLIARIIGTVPGVGPVGQSQLVVLITPDQHGSPRDAIFSDRRHAGSGTGASNRQPTASSACETAGPGRCSSPPSSWHRSGLAS